jgi:hypothetical protein
MMAERKIRKGDFVRFRYGIYTVNGEVIEDRGPIGVGGRHLYLVEFRRESHSEALSQIELPAMELELIHSTASAK